jgi:hypothetical protein
MIPSAIIVRPKSIGKSGKRSIVGPHKPGNLYSGDPNYPPDYNMNLIFPDYSAG